MPSPIFQLCDDFVDQYAKLYPLSALYWGVPGQEGRSTDLSPAGHAARARLREDTLRRLDTLTPTGRTDQLAADYLRERLSAELAAHRTGEDQRAVLAGFGVLRTVHTGADLLPHKTEDDWQVVAAALRSVPETLASWRLSTEEGMRAGRFAARRQALGMAEQAANYAADAHAELVAGYGEGPLRAELDAAVAVAQAAYGKTARFLTEDYAPVADETDCCGEERYQVASALMIGARIDPREAYDWAWDELHRIEDEMVREAAAVTGGGSVAEAIALLDETDYVDGTHAYQEWLQERHDRAIDDLDGRHFDINPGVRTVQARLAPDAGGSAPYYIAPSEDLTRPGITWWPTNGRSRFALWSALTVVFHEGVPGHHLQRGQERVAGESMSRFSRLVGVSGNAEGWALYAERLADELGWFDTPGRRLGMLLGSALRACRVLVDIGLHVGFPLPAGEAERHGPQWTYEVAVEVLDQRARLPKHQLQGEATRYFGWPAQASCYKLGERAWLAARAEAQGRLGSGFDLKVWHTAALGLGPVGLSALGPALRGALSR
ncbi:MAG TPA: DUF885 domain-containing protein [Pseudonocardiaceae bacterium]|nr:DUF885 domain-containing protein [Pseudonocardiaceae bacterium]